MSIYCLLARMAFSQHQKKKRKNKQVAPCLYDEPNDKPARRVWVSVCVCVNFNWAHTIRSICCLFFFSLCVAFHFPRLLVFHLHMLNALIVYDDINCFRSDCCYQCFRSMSPCKCDRIWIAPTASLRRSTWVDMRMSGNNNANNKIYKNIN